MINNQIYKLLQNVHITHTVIQYGQKLTYVPCQQLNSLTYNTIARSFVIVLI